MLIVATLRPGEVGPDLESALAALAGPIADRVDLAGLSEDDVRALLGRHGVPEPAPATVALVSRRTGGNPLFVRELARLIAVEGEQTAAHAVPAGVRDVLRRRLGRLPAPAQTVLRYAVVLGRDIEIEPLLRLASGLGGEEVVLGALELGVLNGLLIEPAPGRVRFAHALVCDTLYDEIPRLRRTRLHAAALDALAAVRPDDHAVLAHHALAAGTAVRPARAVEHGVAAARAADRFGAHREAARLWGAVIDLAGSAGVEADREIVLRCAHVSSLAHAGDVRAAVAARREAVTLAVGTECLLHALTSYDAPVTWTIRPDARVDDELVGLIEDALRCIPADEIALRCRLLAALVFELESHDDARVQTASAEAMELSAGLDDPILRCAVLTARSFAIVGPDFWAELAGVGAELYATADAAGHPGYRSQGHHLQFMVALARHDFEEAQHQVDAAVAAAPGGQLEFTLDWAALYVALRALVMGDLSRAEEAYLAAADRLVSAGASNGAMMGFMGRFAVRHAQGRLGELADEVVALLPGMPSAYSDLPAAALVAAGRYDEARAVWQPEVEPPRTYYWLLWMALRAQVASALGERDVAQRCYNILLPWAGTFAGLSSGTVTLGPVAHVLADLAGMLGRPGERAAHLQQAAEVAREVGAPHWSRRAEQALAGPG
ncbi:hypothetical protein [Pseudonocardia sp. 73-21]|uniref:hypothetical protein n=1 Tax=Pseudonocardia sp. 73-21 TaxID=1895809 RepID=UPI000A3F4B8B|nr:hypothetical protein [Pseudonocardia sp. 73-21]